MKRVLIFGDSITYGAWDRGGGWANRLRDFYDKANGSNDDYDTLFYVLGIDGDATTNLLERIENEARVRSVPSKANTVIIMSIGSADSIIEQNKNGNRTEKESFRSNILKLLEISRRFADNVVFVGTGVVESNGLYRKYTPDLLSTNENLRAYDEIIKDTVEKSGAHFIDIYKKLKKHEPSEILNDGLHPNSKGHAIIFRAVKNYLAKHKILDQTMVNWE